MLTKATISLTPRHHLGPTAAISATSRTTFFLLFILPDFLRGISVMKLSISDFDHRVGSEDARIILPASPPPSTAMILPVFL
jgi:hypothetical protein